MAATLPDVLAPLTPALYRVVSTRQEADDITTLELAATEGPSLSFRSGQFNMLTAWGIGEAAISISSAPDGAALLHTVRDVGPVSHGLCSAKAGDIVGVRGPFGSDWGVGSLSGDVLVLAGGIGLAPLRGAIEELLGRRGADLVPENEAPRLFVLVGAREPDQILFGEDLSRWEKAGARVEVTVDVPAPGWDGHVGVVTTLLTGSMFDPGRASALICGPEIMMRFSARALVDLGVDPRRISVSLERNMQCGLGWCGHCQLGPFLLCRDGPVLPYDGAVSRLLTERER